MWYIRAKQLHEEKKSKQYDQKPYREGMIANVRRHSTERERGMWREKNKYDFDYPKFTDKIQLYIWVNKQLILLCKSL